MQTPGIPVDAALKVLHSGMILLLLISGGILTALVVIAGVCRLPNSSSASTKEKK